MYINFISHFENILYFATLHKNDYLPLHIECYMMTQNKQRNNADQSSQLLTRNLNKCSCNYLSCHK